MTIYLDNAATSWPKPPAVTAAVTRWFDEVGVSAARGDGARCQEAHRVVSGVRAELARRTGCPADRVAFTSGATESLNLALRAVLRPGDTVLTTNLEHSSVARPLRQLIEDLSLEVSILPADRRGVLTVSQFEEALSTRAFRLAVFSHASNVVGSVVPAADVCALARAHGCLSLLDASQTAGLLPIDVGADLVAASAHKSLLGPPGLGFLAVATDEVLRWSKQGGTGSSTALDRQPTELPAAIEAGTPNTPAIFGLAAALSWHSDAETSSLTTGLRWVDRLCERLLAMPAIDVLQPPADAPRVPVLSFVHRDYDPAELGIILAEADIHVRSGHHCAPWIHEVLGTTETGTVRVSPGPFSTDAHLDRLLEVLDSL